MSILNKPWWVRLSLIAIGIALFLPSASYNNINVHKHVSEKNTFVCVVNCMDGRIQDAVKNYMQERYGVDFVDMVTEPGPNKILAENQDASVIENIRKRIEISVHHHGAKAVAVVGHFGCAGNPVDKEEQIAHLREAKKTIESFGLDVEVILLWVPEGWKKTEVVE